MVRKPYAPACDRNRDPILNALRVHFADRARVLEIGSGTGQHAVYFAQALQHLWQTSDCAENLPGIRLWIEDANVPSTPPPLELDVNADQWPRTRFDAVFSANTLHIMSWAEVERMFSGLAGVMTADAKLTIYGPFNYGGRFTSQSNAAFDASLKAQSPHMGIRNFEAVDALAQNIGLDLVEDAAMPANNRCLVWRRSR
ncbi:MAG: DUF938 domain-containing protein [Burkholderiales bacterium]